MSNNGKIYVFDTVFAIFACDSNGNVLLFEELPRDVEVVADKLLALERGELIDEIQKLYTRLTGFKVDTLIVEDEKLASSMRKITTIPIRVEPANKVARKFRSNLKDTLLKLGIVSSHGEIDKFIFSVSMLLTRKKLREAAEKRDLLVAQAINAIDDLNKSINLLVTRLREWYGIHFPELNDLIKDHRVFVRLVSSLGLRSNFTKDNLVKLGIPEGRARRIEEYSNTSIGADIADFDIKPMIQFSSIIKDMYSMRESLEKYIDQTMDEVAPNIKALIGPLIGARLISLAGGLEELAKMPASTIQVLGAEKALFRALRTGAKPPKHGVIFQCPEIHRAPKWQRGKIARALAGKLTIAARVDAFTGTYIADELKSDLDKRIEEIKKIYAKPPKRIRIKRERREKKRRKKRR
ncbi:MAG: C/D box methylation guide ribonucleoprotein complex aNOP56 subunit [archaeon GB-1867-035]|nr:C/D box methylation guide ribonucleoprotein complex aNOP56 subunit [Candidatus Culexmicrobium profundum]